MKLDYKSNINAYGDSIVRLFDFGMAEAVLFRDAVQKNLVLNNKSLDLSNLEFIEGFDCTVIFQLSVEDEGLITTDNINFTCGLTLAGYEKMVALMAPFCLKEAKTFQMLYDVDSQIDLLFSPVGS
jgi:hypothetical protein